MPCASSLRRSWTSISGSVRRISNSPGRGLEFADLLSLCFSIVFFFSAACFGGEIWDLMARRVGHRSAGNQLQERILLVKYLRGDGGRRDQCHMSIFENDYFAYLCQLFFPMPHIALKERPCHMSQYVCPPPPPVTKHHVACWISERPMSLCRF